MTMLYSRPGENREPLSDRSWGIAIHTPDKRRYFVPGGTAELAMVLVRAAFSDAILVHPETRVEFGEADGTTWTPAKVLKAPVEHAANPQ